jgi:hypothetical protein
MGFAVIADRAEGSPSCYGLRCLSVFLGPPVEEDLEGAQEVRAAQALQDVDGPALPEYLITSRK